MAAACLRDRAAAALVRPLAPCYFRSMERNGTESPSAAPRWSWPGTLLCAVAIALAGVVAYWNSLDGQFMFDDQGWIVDNPSIRHLWPPSEWLFPVDSAHVGGRPAVSLTLALNYAIGGLDVRGYHAVNLAIHIFTALVLFGVARRTLLLSRPFVDGVAGTHSMPSADLRLPTLLAFAIALIWVVHPLNTEAVSYVIQRAELLVSLFYLLTLYAVIRGATASDGSPEPSRQRSSRRWYFAAVVFCFLGMATKEVMVTAPILILLYDAIFLAGSLRRALAARWRLYLAMDASWGVLAWTLAATSFHAESTGLGVASFTPLSYLCTEPGVILGYLKLAVWPNSLCFAYGLPPASWPQEIVLPGMTIVALLALVVWGLFKRPALGFLGSSIFSSPCSDLELRSHPRCSIRAPHVSGTCADRCTCRRRLFLAMAAACCSVSIGSQPNLVRPFGLSHRRSRASSSCWRPSRSLAIAITSRKSRSARNTVIKRPEAARSLQLGPRAFE